MGNGFIVSGKVEEGPSPQELFPITVIFPETAINEAFTVTEFVPFPETIVIPEGNDHRYDVALLMGKTEYTDPDWPAQILPGPVIGFAGLGKGSTVMGFFSSGPKPQALCPFTRIVSESAATL